MQGKGREPGQVCEEKRLHAVVVVVVVRAGSSLPLFTLLFLQMKLLELQELVMRLVNERNDWYAKYVTVTQNAEPQPSPAPQAAGTAERGLELDATDGAGGQELLGACGGDGRDDGGRWLARACAASQSRCGEGAGLQPRTPPKSYPTRAASSHLTAAPSWPPSSPSAVRGWQYLTSPLPL